MFRVDSQLAPVLAEMASSAPPSPEVGDWRAIRENTAVAYASQRDLIDAHPEVTRTTVAFDSSDGVSIQGRWYEPSKAPGGSAVVFAHGGGMIAGDAELFDPYVARYAAESGVPILSVDYRRAPAPTATTPVEDVYAAFGWLVEHAEERGVEPGRIAVMGESAGGGLAAGAALLARRDGMTLARQILVYPMLDDRTTSAPPQLSSLLTWTAENNRTGWGALLGELVNTGDVPTEVAPARLIDHAGLAPAYIEVGELDLFRDESVAYAQAHWRAGVSAELHVLPGAVHGFDQYLPSADIARHALENRVRALRSF